MSISTGRSRLNIFLLVSVLVVLLLAVHVSVALMLKWISGGYEVASDARFLDMLTSTPFAALTGTAHIAAASYAPFQGPLVAAISNFVGVFFDNFFIYRFSLILVEIPTLMFVIWLGLMHSKRTAIFMGLVFVFSPHQILATTVFVQDEIISQLFFIVAAYFIIKDQKFTCVIVLMLGVLFGKVFFVVPLFYILTFYKFRLKHFLVLLVPLVVQIWITIAAIVNSSEVPLVGFYPSGQYASHYWVYVVQLDVFSIAQMKYASLLLCVIAQIFLIVFIFSRWKYLPLTSEATNKLFTFDERKTFGLLLLILPLNLFYLTFYQHNPEYLALIGPAWMLLFRDNFRRFLILFAMNVVWLPNIFYGLNNGPNIEEHNSSGRQRIFENIPFIDRLNFEVLHSISIFIYSVLFMYLIWQLFSALKDVTAGEGIRRQS